MRLQRPRDDVGMIQLQKRVDLPAMGTWDIGDFMEISLANPHKLTNWNGLYRENKGYKGTIVMGY